MAENGWVKIHRSVEECGIWTSNEPFDRRSAWIDLILMANCEDREIIVNNCPLVVHRGQKFTSYRKLAQKWHWSRSKLDRYIKMLKSAGMVDTSGTHGGTLLTIINYGLYQYQRDTNRDTVEATGGTNAGQGRAPNKKIRIEEVKNKEKEDGGPELSPWGVPYQ